MDNNVLVSPLDRIFYSTPFFTSIDIFLFQLHVMIHTLYSVQYTVRYSIGTSTYNCIPVQYFIISFFDQLLQVTDTYKIPLLALGSVADPDLDPNIFGRIQNRPRNCSKVSVLNIIFFFNLTIFNLIPLQTKSHCWPDVIKATVHLPDSSTFKRF